VLGQNGQYRASIERWNIVAWHQQRYWHPMLNISSMNSFTAGKNLQAVNLSNMAATAMTEAIDRSHGN
jgi:hypothetical protein